MRSDETLVTRLRRELAEAQTRAARLSEDLAAAAIDKQRLSNQVAHLSRKFDEGELCLRIEAAIRKAVPLDKSIFKLDKQGTQFYGLSLVDVVTEFYRPEAHTDDMLKLVVQQYTNFLVKELLAAIMEN